MSSPDLDRIMLALADPTRRAIRDQGSVEIEPLEGGYELTLTPVMAPEWAEDEERTARGWSGALAGLAAVVNEGECV